MCVPACAACIQGIGCVSQWIANVWLCVYQMESKHDGGEGKAEAALPAAADPNALPNLSLGSSSSSSSGSSGSSTPEGEVAVSSAQQAAPIPTPALPLGQLPLREAAELRARWNETALGLVHHTATYRAQGYLPPREVVHSAITNKPYIERLQRLEWQAQHGQVVYAVEDGGTHPAEVDLRVRGTGAKRRGARTYQLLFPVARYSGAVRREKQQAQVELVLYDGVDDVIVTAPPSAVTRVRMHHTAGTLPCDLSPQAAAADRALALWRERLVESRRRGRQDGGGAGDPPAKHGSDSSAPDSKRALRAKHTKPSRAIRYMAA